MVAETGDHYPLFVTGLENCVRRVNLKGNYMRKFNRSFIYERKNSERGMEKFIYGTL
jgi:hypothetical protein